MFLCLNNKQAPVTEIHCLVHFFFTFIQHNKQVFLLSFCSKKKKSLANINSWPEVDFSALKKSAETFVCFNTSVGEGRWVTLYLWHICVLSIFNFQNLLFNLMLATIIFIIKYWLELKYCICEWIREHCAQQKQSLPAPIPLFFSL